MAEQSPASMAWLDFMSSTHRQIQICSLATSAVSLFALFSLGFAWTTDFYIMDRTFDEVVLMWGPVVALTSLVCSIFGCSILRIRIVLGHADLA